MSKLLKKQREDLGKDIKEIAADTRIKASCLQSIEDEDYEKLPPEVYTRGYIKEYAKYLGLPTETILAPYEKYLEMQGGAKEKKTESIAEVTHKAEQKDQQNIPRPEDHRTAACKEVKTPELMRIERGQEEGRVKRNRLIWKGSLLFLVILAIIYQFVSSKMQEKEIRVAPTSSEQTAQKELALTEQAQAELAQKEQAQAEQARTEQAQKEQAQKEQAKPKAPAAPANKPLAGEIKIPQQNKHQLEISATDATWIQVIVDGVKKKEALMKQGETATFEANETFRVFVGNAGGTTIKFDGKELPGGKKGEVLRLTLPAKKFLAPQAEASGNSVKKIPKQAVPTRPEGSDQTPKDKVPSSALPEPAGPPVRN
jgi:cytoskeletal protein RodZ